MTEALRVTQTVDYTKICMVLTYKIKTVSLLIASLSLPAVCSVVIVRLAGCSPIAEISVWVVVSQWLRNSCCEIRVCLF